MSEIEVKTRILTVLNRVKKINPSISAYQSFLIGFLLLICVYLVGKEAVTDVVMPPRAEKRPTTTQLRGLATLMKSSIN